MYLHDFRVELAGCKTLQDKKQVLVSLVRSFGFPDVIFSQIVPIPGSTRFNHWVITNDDMRLPSLQAAEEYDIEEAYWSDELLQLPFIERKTARWPVAKLPRCFDPEVHAKYAKLRSQFAGVKAGLCDIRQVKNGYQLLGAWSYEAVHELGEESVSKLEDILPGLLQVFGDAALEHLPQAPKQTLKDKEYQVMLQLINGRTREQIAEHQGLTVRQVRRTIENLRKRFGARSNEELIAWLVSTGLVPPLLIGPKHMLGI